MPGFRTIAHLSMGLALAMSTAGAQTQDTGFIESGGEQIYYESTGTGPAVVLSHGLGGNHAIWYQQVVALAQTYRVITWDQRGFGRSTNAKNESGPAAAVEDLKALLDHLGIEKAHVVGQSMGGWCVLGFVLKYPERVHSVVMADTIGGIYTELVTESFNAYIRKASTRPPLEELPITRHFALSAAVAARDPGQAFLYRQIGSTTQPPPENMGLLLRQTAYDLEGVKALKHPFLFVVGTDDDIFPPDAIRDAASLIDGAQVVEIPNTGHSPYFETPDVWNDAVLKFLSKQTE